MSADFYGLLVGIDAYERPISALGGCRNDIRRLADYLRNRLGTAANIEMLEDEAASRQGVIDAFRSHLAQAGPGDVALFAFSGHGSEEAVPDEIAGNEPTGKLQNLLVQDAGRDSGAGISWPLADKELGLLLEEVAARGAHVVAVLDCCHSGDGTRAATTATARQWLPEMADPDDAASRSLVEALEGPRPIDEFLDGAIARVLFDADAEHVALSACQPWQLANENLIDGERRGVFSSALLDVLATISPTTTYRSLLTAVQARVERDYPSQRPVLFPVAAGGPADGSFLDGTIEAAPPTYHMTKSHSGWSVDAGSVHGLDGPRNGEEFRLACSLDGEPCGEVRVVSVTAGQSVVEPIDWEPVDTSYEAMISSTPRPLVTLAFDTGEHEPPPDIVDAVRRRLASSGPSGGPSPHAREHADEKSPGAIALRLRHESGAPDLPGLRVVRADGSIAAPTAPPVSVADPATAAAGIVSQVEHIGRWEQRKEPGCHRPALSDAVTLTLYPRAQGETTPPADGDPIVSDGEFTIVCDPDGVSRVWFQLSNTTDRDLYVSLLYLDSHLACAVLVPTERIGAGLDRNVPIALSLDDPTVDGPETGSREWAKVIVSETTFDASAFELPAIDAPARREAAVAHIPESPTSAAWCSTTTGIVLRPPTDATASR